MLLFRLPHSEKSELMLGEPGRWSYRVGNDDGDSGAAAAPSAWVVYQGATGAPASAMPCANVCRAVSDSIEELRQREMALSWMLLCPKA